MSTRLLLAGFVPLVLLLVGCESGNDETPTAGRSGETAFTTAGGSGATVAPSTARMASRLAKLADAVDPATNFYTSEKRVHHLREQTPPDSPRERFSFEMRLARDLIQSGRTREGLAIYQELTRQIPLNAPGSNRAVAALRKLRALTWLRIGEQENCIHRHGVESCLVPIRGEGVHADQEGSRAALQEYLAALRDEPGDLTSIWLLNIAYMTVGEYPQKVPPQWLIPPAVFESPHDIGRFRDAAPAAGIDVVGLLGGSVMEDLDGDGLLDLMVSSWGASDQLHFLHNNGDGTFEDRTEAAGLLGITGGLNMVHADYDNDGDVDILLLRGAYLGRAGRIPNSLLQNHGDGTFEDATEAAGLLDFHPTQTAAWGDYDGDGWLDLFVGNETIDAAAAPNFFIRGDAGEPDVHPCQLFHNNKDGTFTDVATEVGVAARGIVKATLWGDIDNDGRPDLFLSRMTQPNLLFHNDGAGPSGGWRFTDITARAGVGQPVSSFPGWFWDFDNDGWLDLFVSGYGPASRNGSATDVVADYLGLPSQASRLHLYRNNGDGTFRNVAAEMEIDRIAFTMGSNHGDLDNDGWLDFYLGTGEPDLRAVYPNRMFRNDAGRRFQDVTTSGGFGHVQKGHGISFGDIDNDGDQDVHAVMGGAYTGDVYQNALFENPGHGNHWITLLLEGVASNRSAIGTRIRATIEEEEGSRDIHVVVGTGGSFGASPLRQEIGLGQATRLTALEIVWPASGRTQRFDDVEMDRAWRVREDADALVAYPLKKSTLRTADGSARAAQAGGAGR